MMADLALTISLEDREKGPVLPDPRSRGVEVWRNEDGAIYAYGYTEHGRHWLHLSGLVTFSFGGDSDEVVAFPSPSVREDLIRDSFNRAARPLALQARGLEVLHASAVTISGGVVGLCAVSRTGKSTIAYGLNRRGYPLWADDALAFETTARSIVARRLPFEIRLRPASAAYFDVPRSVEQKTFPADEVSGQALPLAALCVLTQSTDVDGGTVVEALGQPSAFAALLPHAYYFNLWNGERKRRMIERYLQVAAHIPVVRIRFTPGLQRLPALLDGIEDALRTILR